MKPIAAITVVFFGFGLVGPSVAETCPPGSVDEGRRSDLMREVRTAPDETTARTLTNQLWEIWTKAPDAHSQALLDTGIERRSEFDLLNAMEAFEKLISYCPDYAEGYNQRAFVLFIRDQFGAAVKDLDRALERSPEHLGALTGRALALMALGRDAEALRDLEAALHLNPWLKERVYLPILRDRLGERDI